MLRLPRHARGRSADAAVLQTPVPPRLHRGAARAAGLLHAANPAAGEMAATARTFLSLHALEMTSRPPRHTPSGVAAAQKHVPALPPAGP